MRLSHSSGITVRMGQIQNTHKWLQSYIVLILKDTHWINGLGVARFDVAWGGGPVQVLVGTRVRSKHKHLYNSCAMLCRLAYSSTQNIIIRRCKNNFARSWTWLNHSHNIKHLGVILWKFTLWKSYTLYVSLAYFLSAPIIFSPTPANTKHWPNVVLMLARRLRRRPNIKTTLGQCFVLAGTSVDVQVRLCYNHSHTISGSNADCHPNSRNADHPLRKFPDGPTSS